MAQQFEAARRLYDSRLRPLLLEQHGLTEHAAETDPLSELTIASQDAPARGTCPNGRGAAGLDANHLVALNWGQVKGLFPGQETSTVVQKLRHGRRSASSSSRTTSRIRLRRSSSRASTSTRSSIAPGTTTRRRAPQALRRCCSLSSASISARPRPSRSHPVHWRGSDGSGRARFENVRDRVRLPDASLKPTGADPKIVLDLPFDEDTYGPSDDRARVQEFREANDAAETVCWLPNFFSRDAQERPRHPRRARVRPDRRALMQLTDHLPPGQRPVARQLLENQRTRSGSASSSRSRRRTQPPMFATGLVTVDLEASRTVPIARSIVPAPTAGRADACSSARGDQRPAHGAPVPGASKFESEVRDAALQTVRPKRSARLRRRPRTTGSKWTASGGRCSPSQQPLELGTQYETAFVLGHHWRQHLDQQHAADGSGALTVKALRDYIDRPKSDGARSQGARPPDPRVRGPVEALCSGSATHHSPRPRSETSSTSASFASRSSGREDVARSVGPCCIRVRPCPSPLRTASEVARLTQDLREQQSELRESSQARRATQGVPRSDRPRPDESNRWKAANCGAELLARSSPRQMMRSSQGSRTRRLSRALRQLAPR